MKDSEGNLYRGFALSSGILIVGIVKTLSSRLIMINIVNLNLRIENILRGIIFEGIIKSSVATMKFMDMGRISNNISNDLVQIGLAVASWNNLIICPILVILYSLILFKKLGSVGICMPIYLLMVYFHNKWVNEIVLARTKAKNLLSDRRGKKVNEAIEGIKLIKFGAYEEVYESSIGDIRIIETEKIGSLFFFTL